jgi:hypothetical protein
MSAQLQERKIWMCGSGWDVEPLRKQLQDNPDVWDRHTERTAFYGSPHGGISDIWVRFRDRADYHGDASFFAEEHESVWYPVVAQIPAAWSLARKVKRFAGAKTLGGVLITRIPPGGKVDWHIDGGWHARHYRKVAVQVMGNDRQRFQFEGEELRPNPGDVYEFRNEFPHAVFNESDEERITLICCVR